MYYIIYNTILYLYYNPSLYTDRVENFQYELKEASKQERKKERKKENVFTLD